MTQMTPQEIVHELDKHIVGQGKAKKAVAIALRNRWRRQQVDAALRPEITPKNILMIGPTGVGKTEIARRLARLANAALGRGLAGLEFAHGIPGTLGGGVMMNAGAYGGEMRQVVTEVTALYPDGIRRFTGDQAEFAYRHSRFLEDGAVVLGAAVLAQPGISVAVAAIFFGAYLLVTGIGQINRSHMIAGLCRSINRPMVVLCQDDLAARRLGQRSLQLGNAPELIGAYHSGLRANLLKSPLMDAKNYMQELESAYRQTWQNFCII